MRNLFLFGLVALVLISAIIPAGYATHNPNHNPNPNNNNPNNGNNGNDGEQGNSGNDNGNSGNDNGNDCQGQSCEEHGNDDQPPQDDEEPPHCNDDHGQDDEHNPHCNGDDDSGNGDDETIPNNRISCGIGDCESPTLGKIRGQDRFFIENGFGINGDYYNVKEYSQVIPRPQSEPINSVILKIYENSGVQNLNHVGLSLNLCENCFIGQNSNDIVVTFDFDGNYTVTSNGFDFANAVAINDGVFNYVLFTFSGDISGDKLGVSLWDDYLNDGQNYFYFN